MITMRFEGGRELSRELDAMSKRVGRSVLRAALIAGGEPMAKVAASNAPREAGAPDLADNIGMSNTRMVKGHEVGIAIGPTTGFFYGYFQEFGTVRHAAQAFMRPAFDTEQRRVLQIISDTLWAAIIKRGGGPGPGGLGGSGGGGLS